MILKMQSLTHNMKKGSDITLRFDDKELPGHSQLLVIWSSVLGEAVLAIKGSNDPPMIPMDGTVSSDWLKVAAFMYPSGSPRPEVSWDNVEALLVLADKYDMPGIGSMAADFLKSVPEYEFSSSSTAQDGIWKWLLLSDRVAAGHPQLLEDLIQKVAASFQQTCTEENVGRLSQRSVVLLTCALAGTWPAPQGKKAKKKQKMCGSAWY
jgi:hypothetical protein